MIALVYEPQYVAPGWFDDQATRIGWFDEELWDQPTDAPVFVSEPLLALDALDAEVVPSEEVLPPVHWGGIGGPGKILLPEAAIADGVVVEVRVVLTPGTARGEVGLVSAPPEASIQGFIQGHDFQIAITLDAGTAKGVKDWRKYNEKLLLLVD